MSEPVTPSAEDAAATNAPQDLTKGAETAMPADAAVPETAPEAATPADAAVPETAPEAATPADAAVPETAPAPEGATPEASVPEADGPAAPEERAAEPLEAPEATAPEPEADATPASAPEAAGAAPATSAPDAADAAVVVSGSPEATDGSEGAAAAEAGTDPAGDSPALADPASGFAYASGDIVPGTVTEVTDDGVLVDLGDDNRGTIPKGDLPPTMPAVGDVLEGAVLRRDAEGRYVLSARKAQKERTWARLQHAFESGETVFGVVKESTKGGLIVDIGARAFLPESLIDVRRPQDSKQFVGREVEVQVIELQRKGEKVVVNRRSVMEAYRAANREQLLSELAAGQVRVGVVTTIAPFGAFVDLGGVEGLIHISELAHRTVQDASEVLQVGQEVEVLVKEVQFARNKVSLSRKALLSDPWDAFGKSHQTGDLVYGTVSGLAPFGAFVNVEVEGIEGIEGLIHVSELSRQRVEHPSDVVAEGEGLWSKILSIDTGRRRLSLSLRRISD